MSAEESSLTTLQDLHKKIESEPGFAKQLIDDFEHGRLAFEVGDPNPPAAPPAPATPEPVVALTPAPESLPTPAKTWTVTKDQLGRYKNPNELLKAVGEKDKFINRQKETLDKLNAELEALKKAPAKPVEKPTAEPAKGEEEKFDPYDVELMTSTVKDVRSLKEQWTEVDKLRKEIEDLRQERERAKIEREQRERTEATFSELKTLQREIGIETETPIEDIDNGWATFIRKLGDIAGTDGSLAANMGTYNLYTEGVGEDAEQLKSLVKAHGLELPAELDRYAEVLKVNKALQDYRKVDPSISIKQVINILKERGDIQTFEPVKKKSASAAPKPTREDIERALRNKIDAATTLPSEGGVERSIADLSEKEKFALINTPMSELKKNPALKKQHDALMESLIGPAQRVR
jgi:hypothetical protein